MKDRKTMWAWIGAAIVAVIVVAWIVAAMMPPQATPPPQATGPVYAPQGQVTPDFPKDLLIDSSATINQSYAINYSSSTNQYTAQFSSTSTVTQLFNSYKAYLVSKGWTITGTLTTQPDYDIIAASQGNAQMEAVIAVGAQKQGSQATVTYVTK